MATQKYVIVGDASSLIGELNRVNNGFRKVAKSEEKLTTETKKQGDAMRGLAAASRAAGGPVGEYFGLFEDSFDAFTELSPIIGAGGSIIAGITAAGLAAAAAAVGFGAMVAGLTAAVLASDELSTELEYLNSLPSFQPIDEEAQLHIDQVNDSFAALQEIFRQLVVDVGAKFAPEISNLATVSVSVALATKDMFNAWIEGEGIIHAVVSNISGFMFKLATGPIGMVVDALILAEKGMKAVGLIDTTKLADGWADLQESIGDFAADKLLGAAGKGLEKLADKTRDYGAEARLLTQIISEQTAETKENTKENKKNEKSIDDKTDAADEHLALIRDLDDATKAHGALQAEMLSDTLTAEQKLTAQKQARIDKIKEAEKRELAAAAAAGTSAAELQDIEDNYRDLRKDADDRYNRDYAKLLEEQVDAATEAEARKVEAKLQAAEDEQASLAEQLDITTGLYSDFADAISNITTEMAERRQEEYESQIDKVEALEAALEDASGAEKKRLMGDLKVQKAILAEKEQMAKEAAHKQWLVNQATAIADIAVNGASMAIAWGDYLGPPGVAAAIALTGAQAIVAATASPPEFPNGGVMSPDHQLVGVQTGESILNRRATAELGRETINELNSGNSAGSGNSGITVRIGSDVLETSVYNVMSRGGRATQAANNTYLGYKKRRV